MSLSDSKSQLNETFKILTFDFVSSVQKMASLRGERLLYSDRTLFSKITNLLKYWQREQVFEDYSKLLENSQDQVHIQGTQGIKYECFEKDLSVSVNSSSQARDIQSEMESEINESQKDSQADSTEKIKRQMFSNQKFMEFTKYTGNSNDIYQFVENLDDECKREIDEYSPIEKLQCYAESSELPRQIQPSVEVKQQEYDENHMCEESMSDSEDGDYEEEEESSDSDEDSQFTPLESEENLDDEKEDQDQNQNKQTQRSRLALQSNIYPKKYRSYSDTLKKQAVKYATEMGYDFTCKALQIPKKNISRWMRQKGDRSGVRGRKPGDPKMEANLTAWIKEKIKEGKYVTQTEIRKKAKEESGCEDFKASKGWLEKYFRRNKMIGEALNNLLYIRKSQSSIIDLN